MNSVADLESNDQLVRYRAVRDYLLSNVEAEAYIKGLLLSAKRQRIPFIKLLEDNLNGLFFGNNESYKSAIISSAIGEETTAIISEIKSSVISRVQQSFPNLRAL